VAKGRKTGGRKPGSGNKLSGTLKDIALQALSNVGGVKYLETIAREQPGVFMAFIGRIIPVQVKDGGPEAKMPLPVIHEHVHD
jgi:hypothetical protein